MHHAPHRHLRLRVLAAHLLLLGVVLVWGTTFTVVKAALRDCSPLVFNLLRMALATVALAAFNLRRLRASTSRDLLASGAAGFFLALGYQFQTAGLARTSPSKSAFITGLVVVLVPLFSIVPALRPPGARAPRWNAFLGAALAFIGEFSHPRQRTEAAVANTRDLLSRHDRRLLQVPRR